VAGGSLVNFAFHNVDNFLIGKLLGTTPLGYYTLAYNLVLLPATSIGGNLSRVMFPALASLQQDLPRFRSGYVRMLRALALTSLPAIAGLGLTAPLVVQIVYGPGWTPAVPLVQILAIIGACEALNTSGMVYYATGRPHIILAVAAVTLVFMTMAFIVGANWGATGVAWAYVAISPVVFGTPHLIANRMIALRWDAFVGAIAVPIAAVACMCAVVILIMARVPDLGTLWVNLLTSGAIGAAVYATALLSIAAAMGQLGPNLRAWLLGGQLAR
jgi:O-antigen/teichoic acid export membrane protein